MPAALWGGRGVRARAGDTGLCGRLSLINRLQQQAGNHTFNETQKQRNMYTYLIDNGWPSAGGVVRIGRGVSASIGVWRGGGRRGDALIARFNQCRGRGGGALLTQHSTTGGVALCRRGGDGLVVWLLRKLMC